MSERTEDVEALAKVLYDWLYPDEMRHECEDLADQLLASDWLAAHDAEVRRETLAEVERRIAEAAPSIGFGVDSITGAEDPQASAYVEGFHDAWQVLRGMAEAGEPDA